MKQYELVAVMDSKATAAKKKAFTEKLEKQITVLGGKVLDVLDWGSKELAYPIKKNTSGVFLIVTVELNGAGAKEMVARLHLDEMLIRYLFIEKTTPLRMKSATYKQTVAVPEKTEQNDEKS